MKENPKKQVKPEHSVKPKAEPNFHVQKALEKGHHGQGKFLTGHGKPRIKPARGKKNIVKKTVEKKLDLDHGKWF